VSERDETAARACRSPRRAFSIGARAAAAAAAAAASKCTVWSKSRVVPGHFFACSPVYALWNELDCVFRPFVSIASFSVGIEWLWTAL
jgi:hypothetical protein